MTYRVAFSPEAEADLVRLFEHAFDRELNSASGDLGIPDRAIDAIQRACQFLEISPFSCRKAGESALVRELVIPFGSAGFVALFKILDDRNVLVGAVRHQRESDFL